MPLPAPDLDDRRFQDLVDEAKRMVQKRCPEWTDHNVSDPGVTLIELFAWMADQLLYRLNRVPDRNYVKFLDLLDVHLQTAAAARTDVTFWLAGPAAEPVTIPRGVEVATPVSEFDEALRFSTTAQAVAAPTELVSVKVQLAQDDTLDRGDLLRSRAGFSAFGDPPAPGQGLLLGLVDPLPSTAVRLRFDCRVEGVGVDPEDPPLLWEAWTARGWVVCDLERDGTGGLNTPGDVVVHLPPDHEASLVDRQRAGWLRCRIVAPREGQPAYTASPQVTSVTAATVGITVTCLHARTVTDEVVGLSEGVPGQRFELAHGPVLADEDGLVLEVAAGSGWEEWTEVDDFAASGPDDPVFVLDAVSGEVAFGPGVRLADGSVRQHGRVPPHGAPIRVPLYRTGGGAHGNVAPRTLTQLTSALPSVHAVVNRGAATGGVDPESLEEAMQRGPVTLRTRNRAVTVEDYEVLARDAAPEVARVRAVADPDEVGVVRVLVVPALGDDVVSLPFEDVVPDDEVLGRIAGHLDERRTVGARVVVEPPLYQGIAVEADVLSAPRSQPDRVRRRAVAALHEHFHPTRGGRDGTGWPFGRPANIGEVFGVLQRVPGVELVERAALYAADPFTGERSEQLDRIAIEPNALLFSYEHDVSVEPA